MILWGVDPGGTTGLQAIFFDGKKITPAGEPLEIRGEEAFFGFLDKFDDNFDLPDTIVCEGFWLEPRKMKDLNWDPLITPQVIGALRYFAHRHSIQFVAQKNSVKPVGYGWSNQKYVAGKKGTHRQDALAHVVYYAVKFLHAVPLGNPTPLKS